MVMPAAPKWQLPPALKSHRKSLGQFTSQCLKDRRIGELSQLQEEIGAWSEDVTSTQRGVDWQMKIDDARCKLTTIYPKILIWRRTSDALNGNLVLPVPRCE